MDLRAPLEDRPPARAVRPLIAARARRATTGIEQTARIAGIVRNVRIAETARIEAIVETVGIVRRAPR
jgi:hypothetical protein